MIRRQKHTRRKPVSEINVVPYIDVMLVLLIIFMITTPLITQGVDVNLPKANTKTIEAQQQTPLIISVDKGGHYYLNVAERPETPLTSNALVNLVAAHLQLAKQAHINLQVLVRGDQGVNYGAVVYAMSLLQQAGVAQVGLMTEAPQGASG